MLTLYIAFKGNYQRIGAENYEEFLTFEALGVGSNVGKGTDLKVAFNNLPKCGLRSIILCWAGLILSLCYMERRKKYVLILHYYYVLYSI